MLVKTGNVTTCHMGRLEKGDDIYNELEAYVIRENITWATVTLIGAVEKAKIAYYNQETREYEEIEFNGDYEITGCRGNVTIKDGKPMFHAHITLGDDKGRLFGGHLVPGTIAFAAEFWINEIAGEGLERGFHEETSLFLWR